MARRGGRQKGTPNKKTVERREAERLAASRGERVPDAIETAQQPGKATHVGRKKGTPNKATTERKSQMSEAVAAVLGGMTRKAIDAMTPRDVIHLVMMQGLKAGDLKIAFMAAAELAPYAHPRLSAVTVAATADPDLATLSDAEIDARIAKLTAKPARAVH